MDEEIFREQLEKKTVFRSLASLDKSWVPDKLYCRDYILKNLIHNYQRILEEKVQPPVNNLIIGKGGTGKTCTARYFGKNFRAIALEKNINFFIEYFDCINFHSKGKIIRELLAKYTHGSGRGYNDDKALNQILTKLIRNNVYMLLIIDEVQLLKPDEVLAFLNIPETFSGQNVKLSILLICRQTDWMRIENERILSCLNGKISLKPYDFEESMKILEYRSDVALREKVIDEDLLTMISQIVVENNNMRHGIDILRNSGLQCDKEGLDQITADIIREASEDVYPTFRVDIIDVLKDQELFALYSIVKTLIKNNTPFVLVDDAYEEYQSICKIYSVEAHMKMSFRKYVRQLNQLKIIASRTVRIEDATRGRHLEITLLNLSSKKLAKLLEDIFERRFFGKLKFERLSKDEKYILIALLHLMNDRSTSYLEIYTEYKEVCKKYRATPILEKRFIKAIQNLNKVKIIDFNISIIEKYQKNVKEIKKKEDRKIL